MPPKTVFPPPLECWHDRIDGKYDFLYVTVRKKTILWFLPRECEVRVNQGRLGGERERAILLYWIQKPTVVTIGLCCFSVCEGGSCPFELFRRCDNGWMLRTYVERPLWLMEEEHHAGPAVWEITRPLLSLLTPQLMNAWMAECRYRPFRGQSPQEFTLAQTHPAIENTFA